VSVVRVAVDAMGGDHAPRVVVEGAVAAARELGVHPILVGAEDAIRRELARFSSLPPLDVVDAPEVIEMHEHPAMALRRKRRSSIVVAMQQVKDGAAEAVVSAGHTGAAMAAAQFVLGRLPAIDRPAIAAVLPTISGVPVVMLDVGANVDCKPSQLAQFAMMGSVYSEILGVPKPRVGLLSNGEEDTKGNDLTIRAAELLRGLPVTFVGNVEGRDLLFGAADVIVCDGFVGNVAIKLGEGLVLALRDILRSEFAGWSGRLWQLYLIPVAGRFRRAWNRLDYREHGGAPLLGIDGVCVIAHGRSNARAIRSAIRVATEASRHELPGRIRAAMAAGAPLAGVTG
jgi:glycerol-3-phosphate acyltransferase PlsX